MNLHYIDIKSTNEANIVLIERLKEKIIQSNFYTILVVMCDYWFSSKKYHFLRSLEVKLGAHPLLSFANDSQSAPFYTSQHWLARVSSQCLMGAQT